MYDCEWRNNGEQWAMVDTISIIRSTIHSVMHSIYIDMILNTICAEAVAYLAASEPTTTTIQPYCSPVEWPESQYNVRILSNAMPECIALLA